MRRAVTQSQYGLHLSSVDSQAKRRLEAHRDMTGGAFDFARIVFGTDDIFASVELRTLAKELKN